VEVHANNLNFVWSKDISKGAQYVTLDSKIKCLSLVFGGGGATNKTKIGTAYTWGSINSKLPGPIIIIDQSEKLSFSQVQFITLFLGGAQLVLLLLLATASCTNLVQINQFPELKQYILTFSQ
jgi:hypothetical protein